MSVHKKQEVKKITTHQLQEMKNRGEKIAMLTAYDYSMAKLIDGAGIDVILVGDSASNVMAGYETFFVSVELIEGSTDFIEHILPFWIIGNGFFIANKRIFVGFKSKVNIPERFAWSISATAFYKF
jgi:hypothetical protein